MTMRLEYDPTTPRHQHVVLDGIRYRLTQWDHLQAVATVIEGPVDGWATGHIGNVRYAAPHPGGAL